MGGEVGVDEDEVRLGGHLVRVRVRARVRVRVWVWVGSRRSAAGPSLNPPADYLLPPYSPLIRP